MKRFLSFSASVLAIIVVMLPALAADQGKKEDTQVFTNTDLRKYDYGPASDNQKPDAPLNVTERTIPSVAKHPVKITEPLPDAVTGLGPFLRQQWDGLKAALIRKDIDAALTYFIDQKKTRQRIVFESLKDKLPIIAATWIDFHIHSISGNGATYNVIAKEGCIIYSYPGRMVKDLYGNWKFYDF